MNTMLLTEFQEYSLKLRERSLLGRKGPCSVRKPNKPEHPGPPFVQKAIGSSEGEFEDSTNLLIT
jgi:hypothetical protein